MSTFELYFAAIRTYAGSIIDSPQSHNAHLPLLCRSIRRGVGMCLYTSYGKIINDKGDNYISYRKARSLFGVRQK